MSGGHAHVENSIWMRSLLMAGIFLTIGVVSYGVLAVGVASGLHDEYDDAMAHYEHAKDDYEAAKAVVSSPAALAAS